MKQQKKLNSGQQEERQQVNELQARRQSPVEFGTVEELLRHDALHTPVPPAIARRLQESIGQIPPAPKPWWRRVWGA